MNEDETQVAIDLAVEGDEQLLREALKALKAYTDDTGWHIREMGPIGPTHDKLYDDGLAAITKLEQRLLEE